MRARDRSRVELTTTAGALSITLLFLLWLVLRIGGEDSVRYFDDIVTALAAGGACTSCLLAARRQGGAKRRFWVLLAAALGAWTFAEVIWAVYDLVLHVAVPVPSWADVGYLGAIPLAAAALLCHPSMHVERNYKTRATLDGLAIGTALLLLGWTFVLGSLWHHLDLTTAGGIVTLAYPFGDIVIIFFIVITLRSTAATGRRPLFWVLLGLFAMAISDSTYAYLTEAGRYSTGNLVDIGWVVAYLAIAVGASHDSGRTVLAPSHQASSEVSLVSLVAPYVPVLLALVVVTFQMELHHHVDRFAWLTGLGLTLLVIARQALLLNDRRRELFSPAGHEGQGSETTGAQPAAANLTEAAPWPQVLRRTP